VIGVVLWFAPSVAAQSTAVLPDRSYSLEQRFATISPELGGDETHNQPAVMNGYLMLAGNGIFSLWDISDPFDPVQVSHFESPHNEDTAESHQISFMRRGNRFYCASISGLGVDLWDLTDAARPELLSAVELEGIDYGDNTEAVWGVFWQGDYVYAGGTNTGLHVIDASDPRSPVVVLRMPVSELGDVSAGTVFAVGNLLVIGTPKESAGLVTLDIGDPRAPALLDFERSDVDSYIGSFYGAHAYLLTPFRTYDVTTEPSDIRLIGSVETPGSEYTSFGDGFLFLGSLRPQPGNFKYRIAESALDLVGMIGGRTRILAGMLTDDQFSIPIGNLLVLSDDENGIGSVITVHDERRDSLPPSVMYVNPRDGATGQPRTTRVGVSFSDQIDLRSVDETTLIVRPVGGAALAGSYGHVQTIVTFDPDEPLAADTTYEIAIPRGGVTDLAGNAIAADVVSTFSTGDAVIAPLCAIEPLAPVLAGRAATISAADAAEATYRFEFGDGESASGARTTTHAWAEPGRFPITLAVTASGVERRCTATQIVHLPIAPPSARSSAIAIDGDRVWTVNEDANSVAAIEGTTVMFESPVCETPRTIAIDADRRAWVACSGSDEIAIVAHDGSAGPTIALPYGAAPYGIAIAGDRAFVTLEGTNELAILDTRTATILDRDFIGPGPRGLAVAHDGARVYATRFLSADGGGEVFAMSGGPANVITLADDPGPDGSFTGRGIPNQLSSIAISPDGTIALVPSKKDNIGRGLARNGEPLASDHTVRTIVSVIDLDGETEDLEARIDLDDHEGAFDVAFSPLGDVAFVASQGTNRVDVIDVRSGALVAGFATATAPRGLALGEDGLLYVHGFLSRTVAIHDVSGILAATDSTARLVAELPAVRVEPLADDVLRGKRIFYNADSRQMSQDGYVSCASCHLDGGHDARTWDFTDRGEGLRNTIDLRGRAGVDHGRVHWSANFDEIQDFENDVRAHFGGSGFLSDEDFEAEDRSHPLGEAKAGLSDDLDALAAYVTSLDRFPRSPYRNPDGSFTELAIEGRAIFERLDCRDCHGGERLTDSTLGVLHDVGTIRETSGRRLGERLEGIDTPTLRGLAWSAPYLHDGSAPTLYDVLDDPQHGNAASISDAERVRLIAFLLELDNDVLGYPDPVPHVPMPRPAGGGCECSSAPSAPSLALPLAVLVLHLRARSRRRSWR
jgi:MYXO-CTERM domain-containing protein